MNASFSSEIIESRNDINWQIYVERMISQQVHTLGTSYNDVYWITNEPSPPGIEVISMLVRSCRGSGGGGGEAKCAS